MNIALQNAVSKLVSLLEFRNYNETFYVKINGIWCHLHSSKKKYQSDYENILKYLWGFIDESNQDSNFMDKTIKKIYQHVSKNVPNTAMDDSYNNFALPMELANIIYEYIPNDTNMDFITKIKNKILLPKNEIVSELIQFLPHIAETPQIVDIYYKYVDLFTTNNLIKFIRDKFINEFREKKSYPMNDNGKYPPISKEDGKIISRYIYLNKTVFTNMDKMILSIDNSMEQLLFSEIKQIREIKIFENYEYFAPSLVTNTQRCNGICLSNISEIEIFQYIFNNKYDYKFYKQNWLNEIPELLSDSSNQLTKHDIYLIKQYPVWIKKFLENLSENILKMLVYLSKIKKYDRKMSVIERVEKLIDLQNEYKYHILQRCKNEIRNEIKIIDKFTC